MAMKNLVLFLVVMLAVWEASNGICDLSPMAMIWCRPAVLNGSQAKPSESCCQAVKSLSSSDYHCLCDYKNTHPGELLQYGVDATRVAALPATCGAQNAIPCT